MAQRMTDAQRKLAEENMALVAWYMERTQVHVRREDWEDAYQEGATGLCMAAINYRPAAGATFATYALFYIAGYVRHWMRRQARRAAQCRQRLEDIQPGTDEGLTLAETIAEERMEAARRMIIREAIARLEEAERAAITMALRGYTQTEIAQRRGTTQATVCRRLRTAREKIRASI